MLIWYERGSGRRQTMFRKIVTELAYSPALAGNLGHYVKRLRDEVSLRQIGLIFLVLATVVQLITFIAPPESANANNPAFFIDKEIHSLDEYLTYYDQNTNAIRDLLSSLGIVRGDIENARLVAAPQTNDIYTWSLQNRREKNNNSFFFTSTNGQQNAAYYTKAVASDIPQDVYEGISSQTQQKFYITQTGANFMTEQAPVTSCENWRKSQDIIIEIGSSTDTTSCQDILALGLSPKVLSTGASSKTFHPSDRVAYTLTITNKSTSAIQLHPTVNLEDILEYSRILDYGSGSYSYDSKNLSWPTTSIQAGQTIERTFIVQLLPAIPATARGHYIAQSYDCEMSASFGTTSDTPVACPWTKTIELFIYKLPPASLLAITCFSAILFGIASFLYLRSRQFLSELYIIRHNHLGGL